MIKTVEQLLNALSRQYKHDRFAPGLLISYLPGKKNDKDVRVMDGSRKRYEVKPGEACYYGSVKRFFDGGTRILVSFKAKTLHDLFRGLIKELMALELAKVNARVL